MSNIKKTKKIPKIKGIEAGVIRGKIKESEKRLRVLSSQIPADEIGYLKFTDKVIAIGEEMIVNMKKIGEHTGIREAYIRSMKARKESVLKERGLMD